MAKYEYIRVPTPVEIAKALGLKSTDVTVSEGPDGLSVEVNRVLTPSEKAALDKLMQAARPRGP